MRGVAGGRSGNLTPETIRANFAANNPGASDEDIDAAVAALTGQKAKGSGKRPKNIMRPVRIIDPKDANASLRRQQESEAVQDRIDPRAETERMYEGLFDQIDAREKKAKRAAEENQRRMEAEYAEVFKPVFDAEDEAKGRRFASDTPEQRRGVAMYEDLFNREASGAVQVGRREDLGADPVAQRKAEQEAARRAKKEAEYGELFDKADAGVLPITPRESLGADPVAQRKAEQEAARRAKKEDEYSLLFDKAEAGAVPIYSRETMKPIGAPAPKGGGGDPKSPKYVGSPSTAALRRALAAAGVPEDILRDLASPASPGSASARGAAPGAESPEDLAVRRAMATARTAQARIPSRALSTTLVQISQAMFGGREGQQEQIINFQKEAADLQKLANEQRRLQQGRASAINWQDRLQVARSAIPAGVKAPAELDAAMQDAAESVSMFDEAIIENGKALTAQTGYVEELGKSLIGTKDVLRNLGAGFIGGIGGGLVTGGLGIVVGAITKGFDLVTKEVLGPAIERATGNQSVANAQNLANAQIARQSAFSRGGLLTAMFSSGMPTSTSEMLMSELFPAATVGGGQQQLKERIAQQQTYFANLRQRQQLGLPEGYGPGLLRDQGGVQFFNPLSGSFMSAGGETNIQKLLADSLFEGGSRVQNRDGDLGRQIFGYGLTSVFGANIGRGGQDEQTKRLADNIAIQNQKLEESGVSFRFRMVNPENPAEMAARDASVTAAQQAGAYDLQNTLRDAGIAIEGLPQDAAAAKQAVLDILKGIGGGSLSTSAFLNSQGKGIENMMFSLQKQYEGAERARQYGVGLGYYAQPRLAVGAGTNGPVPQGLARLGADLDAQMQAAANSGMNMIRAISPEASGLVDEYQDLHTELQGLAQASADIQKAQAWRDYTHSVKLAKRAVGDLAGLVGASGASEVGQLERLNLLDQRRLQNLQFMQSQRALNYQRAIAGFQYEGDTPEEAADRARIAREQTKYQQQELNINRRIFGRGVKIVDQQNLRQFNDAIYQLSELQKRFSEGNRLAQMAQTEQKVQEAQNMIQGKINNLIQREEGLRAATMDLATSAADATGQTIKAVYEEAGKWLQKAADKYLVTITTANEQAGITPMIDGPKGEETVGGDSNMSAFSRGGGRFVFNLSINNPVVRDDSDIRRIAAEVEKLINRKASLMGLQRLRAD